MANNIQRSTIIWRGLHVRVQFIPVYAKGFLELYGWSMAHLEITSKNRVELPVTETGYRSHFLPEEEVKARGGPEAYVRAWLDHAALSPVWIAKREAAKQMSLF